MDTSTIDPLDPQSMGGIIEDVDVCPMRVGLSNDQEEDEEWTPQKCRMRFYKDEREKLCAVMFQEEMQGSRTVC